MKYYQEIHFIDQNWHRLVTVVAMEGQFENTSGCLRLLTGMEELSEQIDRVGDANIDARMLLYGVRKFLLDCADEVERRRCLYVLLISIYCADSKGFLCDQWEQCYRLTHPALGPRVSEPNIPPLLSLSRIRRHEILDPKKKRREEKESESKMSTAEYLLSRKSEIIEIMCRVSRTKLRRYWFAFALNNATIAEAELVECRILAHERRIMAENIFNLVVEKLRQSDQRERRLYFSFLATVLDRCSRQEDMTHSRYFLED